MGVGGRDTLSQKPPEPLMLTALSNTDILWGAQAAKVHQTGAHTETVHVLVSVRPPRFLHPRCLLCPFGLVT